jgi:hypothetical protein
MAMQGVTPPVSTTTSMTTRRHNVLVSGLFVRFLIAFIISWLIVLAFFATVVISH